MNCPHCHQPMPVEAVGVSVGTVNAAAANPVLTTRALCNTAVAAANPLSNVLIYNMTY